MSDDKVKLDIDVDVNVHNLEQAKALRQEFDNLERDIVRLAGDIRAAANPMAALARARSQLGTAMTRSGRDALDLDRQTYTALKQRFAFERRMAAQKRTEESDALRAVKQDQRTTEQALKRQLSTSAALSRQRVKAEADAERKIRREIAETARMRDREHRRALGDAKVLERAQEKAANRAARGAGQVRSGVGRVAGTAAATGAVAGYGAERFVERGISTRMDVDSAETQLKIFADTDDGRGGRRAITNADIRKLRRGPDGLDNLAVRTGTSIPDALKAYTEAAKAGLIDPASQARNILTAGNGLELDPTKTTKLLGTMARNMGAAATPERLKRTLNAIAIGAREDPTQSNEIVEGLNRAQGVLSMSSGITEEDLVALVSGGQSVGIQPGKAGTTITALARSILEGGNKFLDPKKRKELNFASRKLGFGSAKDMAARFAGKEGKSVLYQIFGNLKSMPAQLRQQVADALSGGQWADEDLQIVNGIDGMSKTDAEIQDPRNAGFLDEANAKNMQSWQGLWNQSKTIFSLFWESFGAGFDGILRDVNAFFLDLHGKFNYDRVSEYVRDALDGLKAGLGFNTWKEALQALVPAGAGDLGKRIGSFARGFSSAIREIAGAVSSVAGVFGGNGGAESIGRLAAQFLALGAAAVVLAPVMGVLGGLASIVLGLANMARAAAGVLGMGAGAAAGGVGSGAVAGALAGIARLLSGGFILGLAGAIGAQRGAISTMILSAVRPLVEAIWQGLRQALSLEGLKSGGRAILNEIVPAPLQRWLEGDKAVPSQGSDQSTTPWVDPPLRKPVEQLGSQLEQNTQALHEGAKVQRQSLESIDDFKNLIHKASLNSAAGSIGDSIRSGAARAGSPLSGSVGAGDGPAIARSTPGGRLPDTGMGRRGIIGGGSVGGNGVTNPGLSGDVAARAREAHDFFRSQGYSEEATAGILASLKKESNFTPNARGDGGGAHGIAQWHADRRRQILAGTGIDVSRASFSDQLKAVAWEMRSGDAGAQRAHRLLMTPGISARDAGGAFVQHFERPARDERAERGALAEGFHRQYGSGASGGAAGTSGGSGNPADVAARYLGMGENNNRSVVERFVGHDIRGAANAWCARFVGASLEAVGQRGTGSAIANSYLHFGRGITAEMVQKGDVLVDHRGKGDNATGGHVGMATGRTRTGRNGQLQLEMIAGNSDDQVQTTWENAAKLAIRRSTQVSSQVAADQQRTRSLAGGALKPDRGTLDLTPKAQLGREPLGTSTPIKSAPVGAGGGQAGSGGGGVHAPISIVSHGGDGEQIAAKVQRHLQDSMNRRTHDFDGFA